MKTRLFLSLSVFAMLVFLQVNAQTPQQKMAASLHKKDSTINALRHSTAAKPTGANGSRLVAAYLMGAQSAAISGTTDSETLSYSGGRGVDPIRGFDFDTLTIYESGLSYIYEDSPPAYNAMQIQTFDAHNNVLTLLCMQLYNLSGAYVNYFEETYTYDASNNMLTTLYQNWDTTTGSWVNSAKYEYTYDGNNNNLSSLTYFWNNTTSTWYIAGSYIYTYTSANKMETSASQQLISTVLTTTQIDTFTYDANNNLLTDLRQDLDTSTNTWVNNSQALYTYDANNNLLTVLEEYWDTSTSSWVNGSQGLYTYDAANDELSYLTQYWSSGWVSQSMDNYIGFVAGQPLVDSTLSYNYTTNTISNSTLYTYTYNNYNQKTSEALTEWNSTSWSAGPYEEDRYYYELYALAVNPVSNTGGSAHIYPVPAQDVLHIDVTWDTPQACSIVLYDVQGNVLKQWQVPVVATYSNTIPVNGLAAGNYFINITGAKGQIVQKLVVSK